MASNSSFDFFDQSVSLMTHMGPTDIPVPDIDAFFSYNIQLCLNYGAQIGASIVILVALLLLSKSDKRRSSIFIVNALSLTFNIIRTVLLSVYFTGPFTEFYAYFGQDYSRVPRHVYATSVASTVFQFLTVVAVEVSLCLQMRVVCVTLREIYQQALLVLSTLIALVAIGFRAAFMVVNCQYIVATLPEDNLEWLNSTSNITTSISICWFCLVFVIKLGLALDQRRKLGVRQFGPMQVIFIMGCQTLVVPAIFSILQYIVDVPYMSSNSLTAVAVFLPLSSLWASASLEGGTGQSSGQAKSGPRPRYGSAESASTGLSKALRPAAVAVPPQADSSNMASLSRGGAVSPLSMNPMSQHVVVRDLEAQGLVAPRDMEG